MGQADKKLDPEVVAKPQRRRHSAQFKREILTAADALKATGGSVGALLRKHGLYASQLAQWRTERATGSLEGKKAGRPSTSSAATKVAMRKLERQVVSLNKKLRQANIIIEIQKKVSALMAMQDDDESAS